MRMRACMCVSPQESMTLHPLLYIKLQKPFIFYHLWKPFISIPSNATTIIEILPHLGIKRLTLFHDNLTWSNDELVNVGLIQHYWWHSEKHKKNSLFEFDLFGMQSAI